MQPIAIAHQYPYQINKIEPLGNGFINDTYLVSTDSIPFVLQKINHRVFPKPEQIMANLAMLSQHARFNNDQNISLTIPDLLQTTQKTTCVCDSEGNYWRALSFIDNSQSLEEITDLTQAEQVGFALAQFHRLTYHLDSATLHDTLPGFHIAPQYYAHYQHIKTQTTVANDGFCAGFIDQHQYFVNDLELAKAQGKLPLRTIHGDPKLNNFLFDKDSQLIVSIVDLDTVKPGLIHYDIGDCLRSCCHNTVTDSFDLVVCKVILSSYLGEAATVFTLADYEYLFSAIRLIPFELGIRFYTDYLAGNRYFKVTEPEQNLIRARSQFRLCESILAQEHDIRLLIKSLQD